MRRRELDAPACELAAAGEPDELSGRSYEDSLLAEERRANLADEGRARLTPVGLDANGRDPDGLDPEGLDPEGLDPDGLDKEGLDSEGLDADDRAENGRRPDRFSDGRDSGRESDGVLNPSTTTCSIGSGRRR